MIPLLQLLGRGMILPSAHLKMWKRTWTSCSGFPELRRHLAGGIVRLIRWYEEVNVQTLE
jgi:hypothetical protein